MLRFHLLLLPKVPGLVLRLCSKFLTIQLIGGMLGTYTNPVTPSAYPSPVTGHGFGNLGGMPWFSTFFSKLPAITGTFYTGNVDPTGSGPRMNYNGDFKAYRVSSVVWNDYAEARECDFPLVAGSVVVEVGNDKVMPSHRRLIPGAQIVSDTYGMLLGNVSNKEYPIAVSGRVLTHVEGDRSSYSVGDCVCSAPNGCISKMTREEIREYPEAIIGTVSSVPTYLIWENKVLVDNRIWIKLR